MDCGLLGLTLGQLKGDFLLVKAVLIYLLRNNLAYLIEHVSILALLFFLHQDSHLPWTIHLIFTSSICCGKPRVAGRLMQEFLVLEE